jgi:uncharacterized protein YsxB (DUF464 family)
LIIKEMNMSTYRNIQDYTSHADMSDYGRKLVCAVAACLLTVVLLGEVGKSPAQAAQRAAVEQGITNVAVI